MTSNNKMPELLNRANINHLLLIANNHLQKQAIFLSGQKRYTDTWAVIRQFQEQAKCVH